MADKIVIKIKQGEALSYSMTIKQDGVAYDLTDKVLIAEAKSAPYQDVDPMFSKTITTTSDINTVGQITDATNGKFQIMFTEDDTSFPVGEYYFVLALSDGINYDIISAKSCASGQYIICPQ